MKKMDRRTFMHDFNHNGKEDSLDAFLENEISTADEKPTEIPLRKEAEISQEEKLAREIIKFVLYLLFWAVVFYFI